MNYTVCLRPALTGVRSRFWLLLSWSPLYILLLYTATYRVTHITDTRPTPTRISYFHTTLRSGYLLIERNTTSQSGQEPMSRWIAERIPFASHPPRDSGWTRGGVTMRTGSHARLGFPIWWLSLVPLPFILPLVPVIEARPPRPDLCPCGYDLGGLRSPVCPECGLERAPMASEQQHGAHEGVAPES